MSLTSPPARPGQEPRRRSAATRRFLAICALLLFLLFVALGSWQVKRLSWKLDLIARVNLRVHALPVPAPAPDRWASVNAADDEYRHVSLTGTYLYASTTKVQAATDLGSGYWLMTPLCLADGNSVLINRGFVEGKDGDLAKLASQPPAPAACAPGMAGMAGMATVTGLLRMTEPKGAFLRHNDAAANRWYSRDVAAIAAARGLAHNAPYFIDVDAEAPGPTPGSDHAVIATLGSATGPDRTGMATSGSATGSERAGMATSSNDAAAERPIGGLTGISFHNSHLVYALTWYALALMVAAGLMWVAREDRKLPRPPGDA